MSRLGWDRLLLRRGRLERVPVKEDSWIVCKFADDVRRPLCDSEINGAREHADCCNRAGHHHQFRHRHVKLLFRLAKIDPDANDDTNLQ